MIKAAVLGSPISHSLSPLLHRRAYELLGVEASYQAIELNHEQATNFLYPLVSEPATSDWSGFSLTMPLKEAAFDAVLSPYIKVDELAERFQTVNTLVKNEGSYFATSTDLRAISRLIVPFKKSRALILGAGGTARAALGALDGVADHVAVAVRNPQRAQALVDCVRSSHVSIVDFEVDASEYELIISTLPSSAQEVSQKMVHDYRDGLYFEVLYQPMPTTALASARGNGAQTLDGLDLLVEQALDQIAFFSQMEFDRETMRVELLDVARRACG